MLQKQSKLQKMKMPEKKKDAELEAELSSMDEGMPAESEELVGEEEMQVSDEMPMQKDPAQLELISDDELLAEIEKRGLMSQLQPGSQDSLEAAQA